MNPDTFVSRIRAELPVKLLLAVVLNLAVLLPYGWAQRHPFLPATEIPTTALDRMIPYSPSWAGAYLSLNLLTPFGAFLLTDRPRLLRYAAGTLLIGLTGVLCFILFPTCCQRPDDVAPGGLMGLVRAIDAPLNACPSLHAAFAVFSWLTARETLRGLPYAGPMTIILAAWVTLIVFSTIVVRQHVVIDLLAGTFLGIAGHFITARTHPEKQLHHA